MRFWAGFVLICLLASCQGARPSRAQLIDQVDTALRQGNSRISAELLRRNRWAWEGSQADAQATQLALYQVEVLLEFKEDRRADQLLKELVVSVDAAPNLRAHKAMIQGLMALRAQQSDQAWARLVEAEKSAREGKSDRIRSRVLNMMAYLRYMHGDLSGAIAHDTQAVAAARRAGEVPTRVKSLNNLGVHLMRQNSFETAVVLLEEARELNQFEDPNFANILINLGAAYSTIGNFAKADQVFGYYRALPAERQTNYQKFLGELGNHCFRARRYEEAISALSMAFAQAKAGQEWSSAALWAANLARTQVRIDHWVEGDRWFGEWMKYRDLAQDRTVDDELILFQANLDIHFCRFDKAEALTYDLLLRANRPEDPNLGWQAAFSMGMLLDSKSLDEQAMHYFQRGIEELEGSPGMTDPEDQIRYFDTLVFVYKKLVNRLMDRKRYDEALRVVESSRARLLRFRAANMAPNPDLSSVRIPADTAMFAYWLSPFQSYLWVLTREGRQVYPLPVQERIEALVKGHTQEVENLGDPVRSASAVSRELTQILLAPALSQLKGKRRVVIVADGALQRLSFETLPSPSDPGHYWIEDQEICQSPSLALYLEQPHQEKRLEALLLVGHPDFQSDELPSLPGAVAELATIQSHFLDRRLELLTGKNATRTSFLGKTLQEFDVIHFATHVVVNDFSPLSSAVMLSPDQGQWPSRVTAQDFMVEDLSHVDLVTLSACSSAGTQNYNGEGLTGLAWAFLWSGVNHVVASHWSVDDHATAQLMDTFYTRLSQGDSPAKALREAQLKLIRSEGRYRKPYYWGAFQIFMR